MRIFKSRYFNIIIGIVAVVIVAFVSYNPQESYIARSGDGEPVYITALFNVDDSLWHVRAAEAGLSLCTVDGDGNELVMRTFQRGAPPVYCAARGLFYFIENNALLTYDPGDGAVTVVCALSENAKQIDAVTDNYALITNAGSTTAFGPKSSVDLTTGEIVAVSGLDWGTSPVLDTVGDRIILWADAPNGIVMYDCATDIVTTLYKCAENTTNTIHYGCVVNNSLYFVEGEAYGILKFIEDIDSPAPPQRFETLNRNAVAVLPSGDGLICAVKGRSDNRNQISFYYFYPEVNTREFAIWKGSHYYLNGSLDMVVTDGTLTACISTQDGLFTCELS